MNRRSIYCHLSLPGRAGISAVHSIPLMSTIRCRSGSPCSIRRMSSTCSVSSISIAGWFYTKNSGPGLARNVGCSLAKGDYLIFLDWDCVLPTAYIETVKQSLSLGYADAFGGPDNARKDFTLLQ